MALPLARGELGEADALELDRLKVQIREQSGFFCQGYKEKCLRRRIAVRMRARGVHRYADYSDLLERDPEECARLLTAVTINVSKFFRNREVWDRLRSEVVPGLFEIDEPIVRIWSAGSASGEEPYTLAMLLLQYAEENRLRSRIPRFQIVATDVDREIIETARRGEYGDLALAEVPDEVRDRWFEPGGPPHRVRPEVKRMVRFQRADMITEPPLRDQHLVVCRNVIIYFERDVQELVMQRFHEALAPGGVLMLGKVETLLGAATRLFRPIAARERIYERVERSTGVGQGR